jgi:diguanylate cyclase (GGDEF)-like protein
VSGIVLGFVLLVVDWVQHQRALDEAAREGGGSAAIESAISRIRDSNTLLAATAGLVLVALALFLFRPLDKTLRRENIWMDEVEIAHGDESARQRFNSELHDALEMADNEVAIGRVVQHVLASTVPSNPAELLLADSSDAHLVARVVHPLAGSPGCDVGVPFECPAVRRATVQSFTTSTSVSACPHLRDRPGGPRSALCVPVAFMGRSLGVLHLTGVDGDPPTGVVASRMAALAGQAGAAIGTVRAFGTARLQANTDSLTGLLNRRSVEDQLSRRLAAGDTFAVVMADLDHFKLLNDTYGHEAGDRALRLFADTVRRALRTEDIFARWGGEEFVIALPNSDCHTAMQSLERVRASLSETCRRAETPSVTASFGIADTTMTTHLDELLRIADGALLNAKARGRNRVHSARQIATVVEGPTAESVPLAPDSMV